MTETEPKTTEIHVNRNAVGSKLMVQPDGKVLVNDQVLASAIKGMKPLRFDR